MKAKAPSLILPGAALATVFPLLGAIRAIHMDSHPHIMYVLNFLIGLIALYMISLGYSIAK